MCIFTFKGVSSKPGKVAMGFNGVWLQNAYHMHASKTSYELAHPTMQACIGVVNNLPWQGAKQNDMEWLFTFEGVWVKPVRMRWGLHAYAFEDLCEL